MDNNLFANIILCNFNTTQVLFGTNVFAFMQKTFFGFLSVYLK
jgi:hypothetical protein